MPIQQKYNVDVSALGGQPDAPKNDAGDDAFKKLVNKFAKKADEKLKADAKESTSSLPGGGRAETTSVDGKTTPHTLNVGGQTFNVGEGLSNLAPDAQSALAKFSGDPRVANLPLAVQGELAKLFAKDPQLGQLALASFTAQMAFPGADKAFNTPLLQGEAMLVTIGLLAQPGGEKKLKDLEKDVGKFAQAYGTNSANERTKLMMFREVVKTNSPEAKAALDAAQLIDKGGSQESIVDIVKNAAKDPAKAQDKLGTLGKLLSNPNVAGKEGVAKALTDFVGKSDGGRSALVEMEKFVDQSKMGNLSAASIRGFAATTGTVEGSGQKQVAGTFEQPKAGGGGVDIKGLLRKRSEKADKEGAGEKLPAGVSGVRPKVLPPIEPFDPEADPEAREQQFQAQYAQFQQSFHAREKFLTANTKTLKRLGLKELESSQKEIAANATMESAINGAGSPEELAAAAKCDIRLATAMFKWEAELKDARAKYSKEASMARRMARAKGNKAEMRTERPPPPPREIRIGPQLEAHMADELMSEFRMAWTTGA